MPTVTDEAICVRIWDWSETSQTVSLFTREHGLVRGVAKGSKRDKSPFSGGFEMLTRGQMVAIIKTSGAMANVIEWDLRDTYPGLRAGLMAFHAGSYAADLVNHAFAEADAHPRAFTAAADLLERLSAGPDDQSRETALARFQWTTLAEIGYRPDLEPEGLAQGSGSYAFDPARGLLMPDRADKGAKSRGAWRVRAETVDLLKDLAAGDDTPRAQPAARRANRLLASYLAHLLGKRLPSAEALFGPAQANEPSS